jgi:malate dehydrogenase (oxaloacetate-decarboxylating)
MCREDLADFQSFPNQDGMGAQLESHLRDINRTADVHFEPGKPNDAIDLVVVTDAEAILGIGGESNRAV